MVTVYAFLMQERLAKSPHGADARYFKFTAAQRPPRVETHTAMIGGEDFATLPITSAAVGSWFPAALA